MAQGNDQPGTDRGSTIIAVAIVLGALVLGWSLKDDGPRYQLAGSGSSVVRMDSDSGEMIACDKAGCNRVQPPDRAKILGPLTVQIGDNESAQRIENSSAN